MKKLLVINLLLLSILGFTQSINEKIKFGFNLGTNYSQLDVTTENSNIHYKNGIGFQLGLLSFVEMSERFALAPSVSLAFNNSYIDYTYPNPEYPDYKIFASTLNFSIPLTVSLTQENSSPTIGLGPIVQVPLNKSPLVSTSYPSKTSFGIETSIGWKQKIGDMFYLFPEIKYTYGLNDINQNPSIESIQYHYFSLVLNFIG